MGNILLPPSNILLACAIYHPLELYIALEQNIGQILLNLVKFAHSTVVTVGQLFCQ